MVYAYDTALTEKMRSLLNDNRITINPPNEIFDFIARMSNDEKIKLPIISIQRTGWMLGDRRNFEQLMSGALAQTRENQVLINLQAFPIEITYAIDVWTKTREENDAIMTELIWYFATHPRLDVQIEHGLENFVHKFNIDIRGAVEDNSDIIEHRNRGIYFRQTATFYVGDAYIWKTSSRGPTRVDGNMDVEPEIRKGGY